MKICPNCGAENENNALYCLLCGFEFENENFTQHNALDLEDFSSTSAAANNQNDYEKQSVYHSDNVSLEENKPVLNQHKSKAPIAAIIAIICILIAGGGIFGIMQLVKNKNGNNDNSNIRDTDFSSTEITSAAEELITTSIESTEETTPATTAPVESTTQTTISDQYTSDEVSEMFSAYITENPDPNRNYENADYGYAFIDLNNDGVQELLITQGEVEAGSPGVMGIFNINNNSLNSIWISDFRTLGTICEDNYIVTLAIYGQGHGRFIYKFTSDGSLEEVESIEYNASTGIDKALHNGRLVSQAEAEEVLAKYKPIKFKSKPLKINIQPTTSAPTEIYAFYGIVATESDSLNLRDKPSTDSKVITQLPKGTKASVYYVDGYSDWYKIYTDDGYEGYVAAQYMKEYNESSNNNNTSYVPESQTPFGTFTYTNYRSSAYSSYTIYEPDTIGIYLNCDIDAFNAKHSDYRIDNIYFWTVKKYSSEGPHDYRMYFTFTGTVLSDSIDGVATAFLLTNEKTGDKSVVSTNGFKATLYKGETFCYDMISGYDYGEYVLDNTTYTLS